MAVLDRPSTFAIVMWLDGSEGDTELLPLGAAFHARRLTLRSSQVGAVPAARTPRWSARRRLTLALALLRDPIFDALLSGDSPFADLPELMPSLAEPGSGALCHTLRYD